MSGLFQQCYHLNCTSYDPSPCDSEPMGRKRRAAGGDTVAHVDHTGHLPDDRVDHGLAMRMVLQAMVAGTKTNAAMPQRSKGDGRQSESWVRRMGELVEHQNTHTTRGMGGSSSISSRDTVRPGGQSEHPNTETKYGEETREEDIPRPSSRSIERDWWDFPSPSGRRTRWLASSTNQGVLEVMAAAASPILRSRVNPPRVERSPAREDH